MEGVGKLLVGTWPAEIPDNLHDAIPIQTVLAEGAQGQSLAAWLWLQKDGGQAVLRCDGCLGMIPLHLIGSDIHVALADRIDDLLLLFVIFGSKYEQWSLMCRNISICVLEPSEYVNLPWNSETGL